MEKYLPESAKNLLRDIVHVLVEAHDQGLTFKDLALEFIDQHLEEKLETSNPQFKAVFDDLHKETLKQIGENLDFLSKIFHSIEKESGDLRADGKFLSSFVLSKVEELEKKSA